MKNLWLFFLLVILGQCDNSDSCKNEICLLADSRIVGKWKLIEECQCYTLGGDFTWRKVSKDLTFTFNEKCVISQFGADSSPCDHGKFTVNQDQLNLILTCPDGSMVTNVYSYLFNTNSDTLILKGYVDEGYLGSKFYK